VKLGRKTLLILVATAATSIVLTYFVLRITFYTTFIELENNWTAANLALVDRAVQDQLTSMAALNREYSQWDDTYAFLQDRNDAYLTDNITASSLDSLGVDSLIILDREGQYVGGIGRDPENVDEFRMNQQFAEFERMREKLSVSNSSTSQQTAVVHTLSGPLLIVALPVLRNDGSGPPVRTEKLPHWHFGKISKCTQT